MLLTSRRYFEPILGLTDHGPPLCDLGDQAAVEAHRPILSPDAALTAFCQLGALRVGTRRAMLFFFDQDHAYVLAEATRSLLQDGETLDVDDELWLGHSKIPRGYSVCEHTTVNMRSPEDASEEENDVNLVHVINNFLEDTTFCDRPYVKGGPKARFYAGVPITTPKGINIGAYCLLDDKPRDGLSEKERRFLRHMSTTVMEHLDMVRAKVQNERAMHMVTGLGAFVEGASDLGRGPSAKKLNALRNRQSTARLRRGTTSAVSAITNDVKKASVPDDPAVVHEKSVHRNHGASFQENKGPANPKVDNNDSSRPPSRQPALLEVPRIANDAAESPVVAAQQQDRQADQKAADLRAELVSSNVRETCQRAAQLLQSAVEVDGAMLVDASVGSYGGLVTSDRMNASNATSDDLRSSTEESLTDSDHRKARKEPREQTSQQHCTVLGSCYSEGVENHTAAFQENLLKRLLRRYSRGKIFNFDEQGYASSDDDISSESHNTDSAATMSDAVPPQSARASKRRVRRRSRLEDGRAIQTLFPGVRSFAIVGVWNQVSARWFAACVIWTYSPYRLLSDECELNFTMAFCDVLMAEIHRHEAQQSDKAKVSFISSISHELRSPLHGILGSAECIQEAKDLDATTGDLVNQIDVCAKTL